MATEQQTVVVNIICINLFMIGAHSPLFQPVAAEQDGCVTDKGRYRGLDQYWKVGSIYQVQVRHTSLPCETRNFIG